MSASSAPSSRPTRFRFGHRARYLGDLQCAVRRTIAAKHGCTFTQERETGRGAGWCSYFSAPARGWVLDIELVNAVTAELEGRTP